MNSSKYKYFKDPLKNAEFTDVKCQCCGSDENCLEGEYFDCDDDVISVCLKCLSEGKVTVDIPDYIYNRIKTHLEQIGYESNKAKEKAENLVNELSNTPPVPWVQYNNWPVCCGDFARYVGEWGKEEIIQHSQGENAKEYIISILDDLGRSKIDNVDYFWDDIGRNTVIFVFECISCSKYIAVCQSY